MNRLYTIFFFIIITILSASIATAADEYYTVKRNDCLWKIALKNKVDIKVLYKLNKEVVGNNPNHIIPGQKLMIPMGKPAYNKLSQRSIEPVKPDNRYAPALEEKVGEEKQADSFMGFFISKLQKIKHKIIYKLDGIKVTRSLIKANAAVFVILILWFIFTKFRFRTIPEPGYYIDNEIVFIGTFKRNDVVSLCLLNQEIFLTVSYPDLVRWIVEQFGSQFEDKISFVLPVNIKDLYLHWKISSNMIFPLNKLDQKKLVEEIRQKSEKKLRLAM
ncbi:MAG: hypothetical protein UT48_C0001G0022 [Parcubacteria group bacterium GW2011_GWE2_39_37]|uniref:LysM domain-containing protein n=1 Tax=Candidatus Falkowbacteria bacterium GW2011_GWF2_39_8 TaxID=1618642 RepID=A0A0G0Q7D2_9BACT|nr:MAG: hypothetical protein UT48_C0001G0022 [Parcubacteria group bacterium GW2011_GWE2_39_37]KKR33221.1 MAG: hypothetical protein UT64_C0012G0013 [Candidatus Falkowbacteria bacterium GW2011_GWF2_39_8]